MTTEDVEARVALGFAHGEGHAWVLPSPPRSLPRARRSRRTRTIWACDWGRSAALSRADRTSAARAPVTVLNNSVIRGLADRAAAEVQARGWQIAQVGNFAGRLEATTVYYSPGVAGEEAAARELAGEFGQVSRVLPRYAGLPPTPAGIVLVVTKDW